MVKFYSDLKKKKKNLRDPFKLISHHFYDIFFRFCHNTAEHSIRGDIQTVDCDAIKKDPSKYLEMYWRVKGADGDIGYCN